MLPIWREGAYEHQAELRAEAESERLARRARLTRNAQAASPRRDSPRRTAQHGGLRVRLGLAMVAAGRSLAGTDEPEPSRQLPC